MKKLCIVFIAVMLFSLTGCSKDIEFDEEQNDLIAEYMAGKLLKYDQNNPDAFVYEPTPAPTATPEPTVPPAPDTNTMEPADSGKESGKDIKEEPVYYDLKDVYGKDKFSITYRSYKLYDSYPENPKEAGYSMDASDGKKYLILTFDIKNLTDQKKHFTLANDNMKYQLDVNIENVYYKPVLSVISNDIQFMNLDIGKKKTIKAVLVFEIEDTPIEKMNLFVSKEDKTAIIKLK